MNRYEILEKEEEERIRNEPQKTYDETEDEDYYQDGDLFDEDQQFHFSNYGHETNDGDDFQDHYQYEDNNEEDQDRNENAPDEEGAERTIFVKTLGNSFWKSDVHKPDYSDRGLKLAKSDDSETMKTKLDKMKNIVSNNDTYSRRQMVGDSTGVSKNTSTLVKMVTGAKLSPDVEGKIEPQLEKEVTGEVVDSKKNITG